MSRNDSPQNIISGYQKRQKMMPYLVGGGAILLVIIGIIILVVVLSKPGNALGGLFATKTATPTSTFTPTATVPSPTPTITPTETLTPTITETPTPSGPQEYEIKEGDTCWDIAVKYNVDLTTLLAINNFAPGSCPVTPGQKILIPAPGQELPTPTLQDISNLPRNTIIEYTVRKNDSLESIASLFNSTIEAIMAIKDNNITNKNSISLGMILKVPVNLVTPTPTRQFTSTTNSSAVPTLTPIPPTATATVKP